MPSSFLRIASMALATLVVCGCGEEAIENETLQKNDTVGNTLEIVPADPGTVPDNPGQERRSLLADPDSEIGASDLESMNQNATAGEPDKLQEDTIAALDSGDLDTAFKLVRELRRVDGANPQTIFLMARVLAEKHRFRQAVKMLDDLAVDFLRRIWLFLGRLPSGWFFKVIGKLLRNAIET